MADTSESILSTNTEVEQHQEQDLQRESEPAPRVTNDSNDSNDLNDSNDKSPSSPTRGEQLSPGLDTSRLPSTMSEEDKVVVRERMKEVFVKAITDIDSHVLQVGQSQCELEAQLDQLIATLDSIKIDEKLTAEISENAKRISSLKSRLTVIHTILSDASCRCSRTLAACGAALHGTSSSQPSASIPFNRETTSISGPSSGRSA